MEDGCYVVGYQAIAAAKTVLLEHLCLPTWIVQVDAVEECSLDECRRYGLEQV